MADKQKLLDALLESVKQCQIRFGGKSELATEGEDVISNLCARFEDICNHGLKKTHQEQAPSLKDMVTSNIQSLVSVATSSNSSNLSPNQAAGMSRLSIRIQKLSYLAI